MKRIASIAFIIIGIIAIILAFSTFDQDVGYKENNKSYGGDAYTGIQNAAAETANNVHHLAEAFVFGVGSILLVTGGALLATGWYLLANENDANGKASLSSKYTSTTSSSSPTYSAWNSTPSTPTYSAPTHAAPTYTPSAPQPVSQTWYCPACGQENSINYGQCKKCGQYRS